ncbi:MAG: sigma-70 family RNA polymerase sigma factor [Coriobacteriia bacterium]|nr:sigma-70 family RNA polymerase sigma factor [Coriobacteriia bacterium]
MDEFEDIMLRQESRLLRAALAVLGNRAEAEDVVQEAFVRLWLKAPQFDSEQHQAAWLMKVTVNLCRSRLRLHWWSRTVSLLDDYPAADDEQQLLEQIAKLPARYRLVLHLHYYEGYSSPEIAQITGQAESTVRQQLTRARRLLKDVLEGDLP